MPTQGDETKNDRVIQLRVLCIHSDNECTKRRERKVKWCVKCICSKVPLNNYTDKIYSYTHQIKVREAQWVSWWRCVLRTLNDATCLILFVTLFHRMDTCYLSYLARTVIIISRKKWIYEKEEEKATFTNCFHIAQCQWVNGCTKETKV